MKLTLAAAADLEVARHDDYSGATMGLYADRKIGGLVFDGFKDFGPACMDDSRQRLLLLACKSLREIFHHR